MVKNSFSLNLDKVNNISLADHKEYANNVRRGKCVVVASVNFLQSLFTLCVLVCCLLCDIYLAKSKYSTICFSTIQSALTDAFKWTPSLDSIRNACYIIMGLTLFFFPALILFLVSFSYQHHDHIHTSFVKIVCFIGVFFNLFAPLYILIVFPTTPKNVLTVSKIRNNLVHESFHISQENLPVYSASDLLQTPHTKGLTLSFKPASGTNFKTVASDEYNSQPRNEIDKNFSVYGDTVADSVRNSYRKYDKIVPIHSAEQARSEKSTNTVATPYHSRIIKK